MKLHGDPVDKQIRSNINKIALIALAFVAMVILLATWFFVIKKPIISQPNTHSSRDSTHPQ